LAIGLMRSEFWYRFPWLLMAAALALVVLGEVGIYAACGGYTGSGPFLRAALGTFWGKQVLWVLVGLGVFATALVPRYTRLASGSYLLYFLTVAVLVVLAAMRAGDLQLRPFIYPTNNAYSWIHLPGISFQPSELTKIAFIMALAYYLRYRDNFRTLGGLVPPLLMALVPTALVLYQPDLGTAMLFLPVLFVMLYAAGARTKHLAAILAIGLVLVPVFYTSLKGYQRLRIDSWLLHPCAERLHFAIRAADRAARQDAPPDDPSALIVRARLTDEQKTALVRRITGMWQFRVWRTACRLVHLKDAAAARLLGRPQGRPTPFDAARARLLAALARGPGPDSYEVLRQFFSALLSDQGHHLWQMQVAVGSGGAWGRGWLEGTQTRYLLPEAHADSLFAVLAEQFGFWGGALVVILYALLLLFGLEVSFSTTEPYGRLIVVGVVSLFAAQSFLNLAMSLGLAPITGVPLPLMSYGGSSMVSSFLALGLLCNVALRRLFLIAPRPFEWRE
jgi:rod shape determining protein RodA